MNHSDNSGPCYRCDDRHNPSTCKFKDASAVHVRNEVILRRFVIRNGFHNSSVRRINRSNSARYSQISVLIFCHSPKIMRKLVNIYLRLRLCINLKPRRVQLSCQSQLTIVIYRWKWILERLSASQVKQPLVNMLLTIFWVIIMIPCQLTLMN